MSDFDHNDHSLIDRGDGRPSVNLVILSFVDGKPPYAPPIPPLAPAKFTGGLYIAEGNKVRPECTNFAASLENSTGGYVQTAAPNGAATYQVPIPEPALRQS
jgi:hypothetical protein